MNDLYRIDQIARNSFTKDQNKNKPKKKNKVQLFFISIQELLMTQKTSESHGSELHDKKLQFYKKKNNNNKISS